MKAQPDSARNSAGTSRLGKTLLLGRHASLRAWAAQSLGESGQVSAYAYLRHALWDPAEAVRESAVEAIGALAVKQSAGELAALYAWSGPRLRRVVLRAVNRIGYRSEFDGILSLARDDPDSMVRALAARAQRAGAKGRWRS
ncbi:MAG: HEAT repeat domain-containing protein [Spirochaetia bacterium]|jgi:HEAT repeat protein